MFLFLEANKLVCCSGRSWLDTFIIKTHGQFIYSHGNQFINASSLNGWTFESSDCQGHDHSLEGNLMWDDSHLLQFDIAVWLVVPGTVFSIQYSHCWSMKKTWHGKRTFEISRKMLRIRNKIVRTALEIKTSTEFG